MVKALRAARGARGSRRTTGSSPGAAEPGAPSPSQAQNPGTHPPPRGSTNKASGLLGSHRLKKPLGFHYRVGRHKGSAPSPLQEQSIFRESFSTRVPPDGGLGQAGRPHGVLCVLHEALCLGLLGRGELESACGGSLLLGMSRLTGLRSSALVQGLLPWSDAPVGMA
jgi:hypothetical protein